MNNSVLKIKFKWLECIPARLKGNLKNSIRLLLLLLLVFSTSANVFADNSSLPTHHQQYRWHLTAYGGPLILHNMGEILGGFQTTHNGDNVGVLALAREIYKTDRFLSLELEGQVGKHFGTHNRQWEMVGLGIGRWRIFPWDDFIDTSFAFGAGLSYYNKLSKTELIKNENAQRLLGYLMMEVTLALPQFPNVNLVGRLHHRSGAKGVIGKSGSNYLCGGLKISF